MSTLLHTSPFESNLTQAERLALCAGRFDPRVLGCDDEPLVRTVSVPPDGFRMPSMRAIREHDALLSLHGSSVNVSDDASDGDESEEGEESFFTTSKRIKSEFDEAFEDEICERETYASRHSREHDNSRSLPSQRGYAAAWSEARSYGYASE